MNPQISVIIPVYNTKIYLKEAFGSLITQKQYIKEIIVVDDGSNDGSSEFLDEHYGNISFIKIVHTDNKGQGHARNIGTNIAKGKYIYYFDSDDVAAPNLFETFHKILLKEPNLELFCFSGESFLDKNIKSENINRPSELSKKAFKRGTECYCKSGEEAFRQLVNNNAFTPVPWLYIFRKSIQIEKQITFSFFKYEDEEFTHKLFLFAGPTYISNEVLYYRRVRADSTMQLKRTFNDFQGYFYTIDCLIKLKQKKEFDIETIKVIEQRINTFIKLIIELKTTSNVSFKKKEGKIFNQKLNKLLKNPALLFYKYSFSIKYGLRKFKKNLLKKKTN